MEGQEAAVHHYQEHPQAMPMRNEWYAHTLPPSSRILAARSRTPNLPSSSMDVRAERGRHPVAMERKYVQQRVPAQPPVCGIHPGKVLSLRTSLGLIRARALIAGKQEELQQQQQQQQQQQRRQERALQSDPVGHLTEGSRGHLTHAKLQPLGVVNNEISKEENLLGVVPVSSLKSPLGHRRPKSSTSPGTNTVSLSEDLHNHHLARVDGKSRTRKRSYSAVLPRNLSDDTLRQLLSISRHTGLVPQASEVPSPGSSAAGKGSGSDKHTDSNSQHRVKPLPPMMAYGELGMKIELKGLKEYSPPRTSPRDDAVETSKLASVSKPAPKISKPASKVDKADSELSPQVSKLSPITKSEGGGEETAVIAIHVTKSSCPSDPKRNDTTSTPLCDPDPPSPSTPEVTPGGTQIKVSIVSLGDTREVAGRVATSHRAKRHPSGKGRLSQGWSPPRPIEALKGNTLRAPRRKEGVESVEEGRGKGEDELRREEELRRVVSPTPSMSIDVNINEFLEQNEN